MKLRYYQWDAVVAIWNYFANGGTGNPVVAMPTGTGKSLVIAGFIRYVFEHYPSQRVMLLTHVKELIEQDYEKLIALWPNAPAGIYSAGLGKKEKFNNITFAGIGSVAKRAVEFGHIDLILIDEAHLVSATETTMYRKFIDALLSFNPNLKVIGFTATAYRMGQGSLIEEGSLFTDICYDLTKMERFNRLIAEGYLSTLVPKNTKLMLEVDGVHKRGGEFIPKELQNAVNKQELTEAAVREAIESGHDRSSWLVFTSGVEHALDVTEILNLNGVEARCVHGGSKTFPMTSSERDRNIREFKEGKFRALVNNNVLTTGFDHPAIDLILNLRPTSSPALWVQMLGRGTRPLYGAGFDLNTIDGRLAAIEAGGKRNCLVLDFGGNTKRLGPINDPVIPKKKGQKGGEAPVKLCEAVTSDNVVCDTWIHASLRFCPECGTEFVFKSKLVQGAGTDQLIKGDLPVVEVFKVDHITYAQHNKVGAPPIMKVSYYCDLKVFTDYVCFEHERLALHKAKTWWRDRTDCAFPDSTADGLSFASNLKACTHLRVWTNKKYPEIMSYCFDGTAFGKNEETTEAPTVDAKPPSVLKNAFTPTVKGPTVGDFDDDIPF